MQDFLKLLVKERIPTLRYVTEKEREGRALCRGNLLLEKSGGGELQPVGQVVMYHLDAPAVCSNFVAKVVLKPYMAPDYWNYVHSAAYAVDVNIGSINQTSGIQNLDADRYFNERAPFPPFDEQTAIATFLDRETAKIDALIAEQEKLLTLLAEKRQATITHAVTKGLNPDAPMKDSGVEWLGEVPAHWDISKVKSLCYINDGNHGEEYPEESDYTDETEGVPFIRASNIKSMTICPFEMLYISKEKNSSMRKGRLETGDILFTNRGEIGKVATIPDEFKGANLNSQVAYLRPDKERLFGKFAAYFVSSDIVRNIVNSISAGSVLTQFPLRDIKQIPVTLPPLFEQIAIGGYIDAKTTRLDALTAEATRAIDLLKERRTALISAAVTGKIDVRHLANQEAA